MERRRRSDRCGNSETRTIERVSAFGCIHAADDDGSDGRRSAKHDAEEISIRQDDMRMVEEVRRWTNRALNAQLSLVSSIKSYKVVISILFVAFDAVLDVFD